MHTFNSNTQEVETGVSICEFEASLIYTESSRTAKNA